MRGILTIPFIFLTLLGAPVALAAPVQEYTPETFTTTSQAAPVWFEADNSGGFYGETTDGTPFTQMVVVPDSGVHLERFAIGLVYFYVSDKGIINASDDLVALSIYLALV